MILLASALSYPEKVELFPDIVGMLHVKRPLVGGIKEGVFYDGAQLVLSR